MKKNLKLPDLSQATHWINQRPDQKTLSGRPLLVYFWSLGCVYCKKVMPQIHALRERCRDQLNIIAVHMPLSESELDPEQVARSCMMHEMKCPVLIDNRHRLADAFGNRHVPTCYLFDKRGLLLEHHMGELGVRRALQAAEQLVYSLE